jgi:hypothetical protein
MSESLAEARCRYATVDRDVRTERMLTEIGLGFTKEQSHVVSRQGGRRLLGRAQGGRQRDQGRQWDGRLRYRRRRHWRANRASCSKIAKVEQRWCE